MAVNKRKVLEAARKYAQKGAKEKALKEYNTLLKLDKPDAKLLLEIGDAHRRWGQNEEAVAQYSRVAGQYKDGGFDARAVAVYKQILNLDAKRYEAYVSLATLYQRMGLDSEAVNALQTAADGYHKEGQKREALELLRKMATLDPSNTTSRMKVADLLRQEEMIEDAVSEYEAVVEELTRQGSTDTMIVVFERILEMCPERIDVQRSLAHSLVEQGQPARAEPYARASFDADPDAGDNFEFLCSIYTSLEDSDKLEAVTRQMAQILRDRGDDARSRELLQRLPGDNIFETSDGLDAPAESSPDLGEEMADDDLLDSDDFLDDEFLNLGTESEAEGEEESDFVDISDNDDFDLSGPDQDFDLSEPDAEPAAAVSEESLPEGDPDQLFAEASVYLRYGKRDQAISSLKAILVQEPTHRDALEKLGECHADADESTHAVACWQHAAELANEAGDDMAFEALIERIGVLDPEAAASLKGADLPSVDDFASTPDMESPAASSDKIEIDIPDDGGLDLQNETGIGVAASTGDGEVSVEFDPSDGFDLGEDADESVDSIALEEADGELEVADVGAPSDATDEVASEDDEFDVSITIGEDSLTTSGGSQAEAPSTTQGSGSATQSQQISEDLEEAQFYFDQEIYDEAEVIYQRILNIAPNHPSALLRLGELRALRGEDPSDDVSADAATPAVAESEVEVDVDALIDVEVDSEIHFESEVDVASDVEIDDTALSDAGIDVESGVEDAVDVDVDVDVGLDAEVDAEIDVAVDVDEDSAASIEIDVAADVVEAPSVIAEAPGAAAEEAAVAAPVDVDVEVEEQGVEEAVISAPRESEEGLRLGEDVTEVVAAEATAATMDAVSAPDDLVDPGSPRGDESLTAPIAMETPVEVPPVAVQAAEPDTVATPAAAAKAVASEADPVVPVDDTLPLVSEPEPEPEPELAEAITGVAGEAEAADPADSDSDDSFDLAAELRETIEEEDARESSSQSTDTDDSFESIFKDFKAGVSKTLSDDDHETRFDLGIAYREMGLFGDAIGEFTICLGSESHRLESLHMMGLCALDLGRVSDAVNHFEQALASEALPSEKEAGLRFDLARSYETQSDWSRARDAYVAARDADASFPGIEERMAAVEQSLTEAASAIEFMQKPGADGPASFESFDDLVAEVECENEENDDFETFDDVVAAAELVEEEVPLVGQLEDGPDEDALESATVDGCEDAEGMDKDESSKPKKKRISFV